MNENAQQHRRILLEYVVNTKIKTTIQLAAAFNYISKSANFDLAEFERVCGVGVVVTTQQMNECIDAVINKYKNELFIKGYTTVHNSVLFA